MKWVNFSIFPTKGKGLSEKKQTLALLFVLAVVVFAVFSPALKNSLVFWDDDAYILNNRDIRSLSFENIGRIFSSFYVSNYHPLTLLSWALDHAIWGLDPFGYHLTNILLHIGNAFLVFWLIRLICKRSSVAFLTALLFAVHPLRVESVAWATERKDVLYSVFYLSALISYVFYLTRDYAVRYWRLALGFFLLSLLSKTMALTLPVMFLVFDYLYHRKPDKKWFMEKWPFFGLSVLFALILTFSCYSSQNKPFLFFQSDTFPLGPLNTVLFYLIKFFRPVYLSAYYPAYMLKAAGQVVWGYLLLGILLSAVVLTVRRTRLAAFGFLFFIVCLLPLLQILVLGDTKVADRFTYLASVGIFFIMSEAVFLLWQKMGKIHALLLRRILRVALAAAVASAYLVLSVLTFQRIGVWKNSETLWGDVLARHPDVFLAYNNQGVAFLTQQRIPEARKNAQRLIQKVGGMNASMLALQGSFFMEEGQYDQAVQWLEKARQESGCFAYNINLSIAYSYLGQTDKAQKLLEETIRELPNSRAAAYYNLGLIQEHQGNKQKARDYYLKSLKEDAGFPLALRGMGEQAYQEKNLDEAIGYYQKALRQDPENADIANDLASLWMDKGNYRKALGYVRRGLERSPDRMDLLTNYGSILCGLNQPRKAISVLKKVVEKDPGSVPAYDALCFAYYLLDDCLQAREACRKARTLNSPTAESLEKRLEKCGKKK